MNAIGIDWGSSSLRAYLFDSEYKLLDQTESDRGITRHDDSSPKFEQTLLELIANWRHPGMRILLSGMITSRNGWIETPYLPCPAKPGDLYNHSIGVELEDLQLNFLPGVCQSGPGVMPDVMRGEELQLLAIGPQTGTELLVLPGTHSKWALIDSSSIIAFRTIPTGELFEVLLAHSLIGALAEKGDWSRRPFIEGVEAGYRHDAILGQLFSCRSSVLLDNRTPAESRTWLSGLLIGREIREGIALHAGEVGFVRLVGSAKLCELYQAAFEYLNVRCQTEQRNAAMLGYRQILSCI
jgi:2-dehydro-3-deoxygalactonokinase